MSERRPRNTKKEGPEAFHNLELEQLINQASKGSVPEAKQEIQPEQPEKPIVGGDDAWIHKKLDEIDSLNFKPGFPAEEYFNETAVTKATASDNPVDTALAKIAAEKKLTGAKFLNYLNDMGGTSAPSEAIEKIMTLASKKLDKDVFEKLQTIVLPSRVNEPEIHKKKANLELNQVNNEKISDEVKGVGESQIPENLPHGSSDELEKFEKGLRGSVEDWQKERAKKNEKSPTSPQESTIEIKDSPVLEEVPVSGRASEVVEELGKESSPMTSEGAVFSDVQKQRLAPLSGDTFTPSHEEVSEGTFFSDAQKEYLTKSGVDMSVDGLGSMTEPTTRKEWIDELRRLIFGEKKIEGSNDRSEGLKEHLAKRSEELDEKTKGYGPAIVGWIGTKIEQYNKLNWKTKLAITGALMAGSALSAGAPLIVSGAFATALYGQRVLGAIGMGMNKRKSLDAKIEAGKYRWLAGKSELAKNAYVALLTAGYLGATTFAVHEGAEGLKAIAQSEWLGTMLGHNSAQPSIDSLETLAPTLDMPSAEVLPDPASVQTLDSTLFAETKDVDQLRILAENSLSKHLTPNEWDVLNNHIASFTPRERSIFDQFTTEYSNQLNGNPDIDSATSEGILPTTESLPTLNQSPVEGGAGLDGHQNVIGEDIRVQAGEELSPVAPFGHDPIDGHPMSELEAQKLADLRNAMHDPRETGAWPPGPPEEKGFVEKISDWFNNNEETPSQFNMDSVSTTEPHIYADSGERLFAYGGSPTEKIDAISKFLNENPKEIVFGTDNNGAYRIPWSLVEGNAVPGEPVRTSGFLGFGSSFVDAPKPEEFARIIK